MENIDGHFQVGRNVDRVHRGSNIIANLRARQKGRRWPRTGRVPRW